MRYKIWLLALVLLCPALGFGQSYEKEYGVAFAWEVKQVDEFIERFNNDEFSFLREYLKKKEAAQPLTRERLLKSLFNAKGTNWNYGDITAFIKQVNSAEHPQYLNFDDGNWYASVQCQVVHRGKPEKAVLKLKISTLADGSSKWVITEVGFPGQVEAAATPAAEAPRVFGPRPTDANVSLNPMSHAIDFMNIDLVTKKPENIENFLDASPNRSRTLDAFVDACLKNQLKVVRAMSISYTFLQIKGWQIEVKQFNRQSLNSGWLISKLVKLS
ncbi:hypothetical protein JAO73_15355 [Hymenobacter sp. BT523]|uniref:hypothetical protein n=1 Tax=Hymenobacter sp. BT523 TaxID=2795725 RepID=UPI0018EB262F|nr:hypothetical protein [Hymenobacter sp. BT523]MBJ6110400.1 hypothetical protein [Hymenobacter sp. BT523]